MPKPLLTDPPETSDPTARDRRAGLAEVRGPAQLAGLAWLIELVRQGDVVVLSGAGLSTESGIPDYRGPTGRARRAEPMTYQRFVGSAEARRRYWARSHVGWRQIGQARPNAGHRAVAALERHGLLAGIVTQNVDGLHQAAGARRVIELHGGLDRVVCLSCRERTPRAELDRRLREANPGWDEAAAQINPDGDAVLTDEQVAGFQVVDCTGCGGLLKPDVIFFGENVPRPRVEECFATVARARALLVLGSSLTVKSGLRFVSRAAALGIPIAIVNQGPTGGDDHATLTLDAPLGTTLTALTTHLGAQ
ncbi:NAD-dependent protein deacetylase [Nonomuraea sp. SYSU D8015]|uniref:NAD-dependent protein deacetylase n=1 Tax=Nonomuraea sp. SYSU D8015 TaxID=2593644 RepID=UPI001660A397|nr:NAD-dependent protein deacetylase [Nonomuraea sp. SYSU D8015]